jgi:hypothetical protein
MIFRMVILIAITTFGLQCKQPTTKASEDNPLAKNTHLPVSDTVPGLSAYWRQGKAEISRFEIMQHRYRDLHPGEVVLIMVTEDFLEDRQVKNDRYQSLNSLPVLKTNLIHRFTTGIYDYAVMTSVFTPEQSGKHPHTLKVTHSSQDWCGQTFMQINFDGKAYRTQVRSYFEDEGDEDSAVPTAMLEDELFNRIRLNPNGLPQGKIKVLPSATIVRLLHKPFEAQEVTATLEPYSGNEFPGEALMLYRLKFPELKRSLEIAFEKAPPYHIAGWADEYPGFDGKSRRTLVRRTHILLDDYWKHNGAEDTAMRKLLGIPR